MSHVHHSAPMVGCWYDSSNFPESFVVINCGMDDYVEIQYLDGELDKLDLETWNALNPQEIAEPEDATAPYGIEHDEDMVKLLNEIESQEDLDQHLRHIDSDESDWD